MTPTQMQIQNELFPSWGSYPSIFHLGHRAVHDLTNHEVYVQEKVDGSQFSFGVFGPDRELRVRSKGAVMYPDAPEKMFSKGVEAVKLIAERLNLNWTYRGEYLQKAKHNVLAYDRFPNGHVILFDVADETGQFLDPLTVQQEAAIIGLETVPTFYTGLVTLEMIREFLDRTSVLGGQKIEGVVIKPVGYSLYGVDKKVLMGKFVSEAFKEIHAGVWKKDNPTQGDVLQQIIDSYRTPARWSKGVQHLREAGVETDTPKVIGQLIKEIQRDVTMECKEEISARLIKHFWSQIQRAIVAGVPEWFKDQLMKEQFNSDEDHVASHAAEFGEETI